MTITSAAYAYILDNASGEAGEIGGILGGTADGCVTHVIFDRASGKNRYYYDPNVKFLNDHIATWQERGIVFLGMFHSHISGVDTLSCGDRHYIDCIFSAMPDRIRTLWFPILVFPDKTLCCYRADYLNGHIAISRDSLAVIG